MSILGRFFMVRQVILSVLLMIGVGFAPAVAQEIFIKKNNEASDSGAPPSLFLKPKNFNSKKGPGSVNYGDKLQIAQLQSKNKTKLEILKDIEELGLKPKTADDVQLFAAAHRAQAQDVMYQRREALMAHLQKEEQKLQARIASQSAGAFETSPSLGSGGVASSAKTFKAKAETEPSEATATPRKTIYVKPKGQSAAPTKVFTDYR